MPATGKQQSPDTIRLWGGTLCLDFANSVDWSARDTELDPETDALRTPADLARWGRRLGVAGGRPDAAELAAAHELRAALHRIFSAVDRGKDATKPDLALLAAVYAQAAAAGRLARDGSRYRLT